MSEQEETMESPEWITRRAGLASAAQSAEAKPRIPVITRELHDMALIDEVLSKHGDAAQKRILDWLYSNYHERWQTS